METDTFTATHGTGNNNNKNVNKYVPKLLEHNNILSTRRSNDWSPVKNTILKSLWDICTIVWLTFCSCNSTHMVWSTRRGGSGRPQTPALLRSTPSLLHVLFLGNPLGIFSHIQLFVHFLRLDIQEETQTSSYLVRHVYLIGCVVVFRCDYASASRA